MFTATAVLASIPASFRCKRQLTGFAEQQLRNMDQQGDCSVVRHLAYGVLWADGTGRITGTVSMALRRATPWQAAQLVAAMIRDGIDLPGPVPAWLNANAMAILA